MIWVRSRSGVGIKVIEKVKLRTGQIRANIGAEDFAHIYGHIPISIRFD